MKPILCYGDACADFLIPFGNALRYKSGEELDAEQLEVEFHHGGSVANTAYGLGALNAPVMFCGTCGEDAYGHQLEQGLSEKGVDTSLLRFSPEHSTMMVLLVIDASGDRTAFAVPKRGASQHAIIAEQIPDDILDRIGWMHSTGMTLREEPAASVQIDLMRKCFERGIPVSFDINTRMEALDDGFLAQKLRLARKYCNYVLGSIDVEIPMFAEIKDPIRAAEALAAEGKTVILRNSSDGAIICENGSFVHQPAYPVKVVDAVGAGDAYNAGFLYGMYKGLSAVEANKTACAVAAYCVAHSGGRACPTPEELDVFIEKWS